MHRLILCLLTGFTVVFLPQYLLAEDPAGPPGPPQAQTAGPNPEILFNRLDTNHDGFITQDELPPGMPEMFKQLLFLADSNGDGKITLAELTAALNQHRPGPGSEPPTFGRRSREPEGQADQMPGPPFGRRFGGPEREPGGMAGPRFGDRFFGEPGARPPYTGGPTFRGPGAESPQKPAGADGPEGSVRVEVYSVNNADPQTTLKVMQTLLAGKPDVRMDIDPKTNNLIVLARPAEHAVIRATLAQMQHDARQVAVIRLKKVDPQTAVLSINKLFSGDDASKGGTSGAPQIDADPSTRQLMIRGTLAQIEQVKSLLQKMGETDAKEPATAMPGPPFGGPGGQPGRMDRQRFGGPGPGTDRMTGPPFGGRGGQRGWMGGQGFGGPGMEPGQMAGQGFGGPGMEPDWMDGPPSGRQGMGPGRMDGPPFGRQGMGPGWMAQQRFGGPGMGPGWMGGPPFGRGGPGGRPPQMAGPNFPGPNAGPHWMGGSPFIEPEGRPWAGPGYGPPHRWAAFGPMQQRPWQQYGRWGPPNRPWQQFGHWGPPNRPWQANFAGPNHPRIAPWMAPGMAYGAGPHRPWPPNGQNWYQRLLSYNARPPRQRFNPQALFDRLDTNHDNQLSFEEFSQGMTHLLHAVLPGPGPQWVRPAGWFGGQGFGPPAHPAMANYPGSQPYVLRERITRLFQNFDKNYDGKLTKDEAPPGIQKNFDRIDADKNGFITPRDLYRAISLLRHRPEAQKPVNQGDEKTPEKPQAKEKSE